MLTIRQPEIIENKTSSRLQAEFEVDGNKKVLWFEVENKYGKYLTSENADAFLVGLWLYAIKNGHNINVDAPISEKLYFGLQKYLSNIFLEIHGSKDIQISVRELVNVSLNSEGAVGTGLSCGIDSLSTIIDQQDKALNGVNQVTHLTFFNVGSHGHLGGEDARDLFEKRYKMVLPCANELGLDLIKIDSNLSDILQLNFQQYHTFRSVSAVLTLQKLFKTYFYASTAPLSSFHLSKNDSAYYDIFSLQMLSTDSTKFYSSCPNYTRVEKTRLVSNHSISSKYLNVCVASDFNCGACFKCLRTITTLDVLGKLDDFSDIFNLDPYKRKKKNYWAKVIAYKDTDVQMNEIYDEMLRTGFEIPLYSKLSSYYLRFRRLLR